MLRFQSSYCINKGMLLTEEFNCLNHLKIFFPVNYLSIPHRIIIKRKVESVGKYLTRLVLRGKSFVGAH